LVHHQLSSRHVLGDCAPAALGEAIFHACSKNGGGNSGSVAATFGAAANGGGMAFKEVLQILVLITKGTKEEKTKCNMMKLSTPRSG